MELEKLLKPAKKPVIVTMGNELRGDDAVGVEIGKQLSKVVPQEYLINAHNVPANFIGKIAKENPDLVLFVDAIDANLEPGDIILYTSDQIIETENSTTHYQEASILLAFLEKEVETFPEIHYLGIQIKEIEPFTEISTEVRHAMDKVIAAFSGIRRLTPED